MQESMVDRSPSRPRVLIILETGDASRYWEAAIPLLEKNGVSPTLLTLRGRGPLHEKLERVGIPTASLDCNSSLDYPRAVLRLSKAIRESGCDLIHASEAIPAALSELAMTPFRMLPHGKNPAATVGTSD